MAIFGTGYVDAQGRRMCGPDIKARTWEEAEKVAASFSITGVLVERGDTTEHDGHIKIINSTVYPMEPEEKR